ncbi:efflux RND transporter periplasmic adaptor subunit [Anthocerotibacter panamensis]|uniref:efflux RND transporter periplasmic adaptor subunit n=1 Tax=Anthocerotibacter panamensis TaxID=2857077 RepID=UPI001C401810|nr:efflux RND transporter periplasmic adaptor subunit [Anthocerotibacter panamensis]
MTETIDTEKSKRGRAIDSMPRTRSRNWLPIWLGGAAIGASLYLLNSQVANAPPVPKGKPPAPVTSARAERQAVPVQISSVGNVEATSTVAVRSQVDGQLLQIHFQPGQVVRQGQVLFSIDPQVAQAALAQAQAAVNKDLAAVEQAKAILLKDQAQLKAARTQLQRYQGLFAEQAISLESFDQYRTNVDALEATVRADAANIRSIEASANADRAAVTRAQVQLAYSTIRAPIDGRTGDLNFYAGNLIKANDTTPLITINRISPVYVTFNIPEDQLLAVRRAMGQGALKVAASAPGDAALSLGTLNFVNNTVDATTGTIKLKATFINRDSYLVPGQFVNTTLTLKTLSDAVVVPSQAVQTGQQGRYVFVIQANQQVEERPVTSTLTYKNMAVIDQGIRPGELVVTDGQLQLVPGTKVQLKNQPQETAQP